MSSMPFCLRIWLSWGAEIWLENSRVTVTLERCWGFFTKGST